MGPAPLVRAEEPICAVSDHFRSEEVVIRAPFTGIIVGVLENPVVLLGHPICHLARIDDETHAEIEAEIARGEFDGYSQMGLATSALARRPSEWSSDPGPGGMHARTGRLYQTTRPRASVTWTACLASCPLFIPIRMRA